MAGQQASGGGNGHADKILAAGPAGIARLGVVADVEARQARGAAEQEKKADEGAGLHQVLTQLRVDRIGQEMEAPDKGQQAGRHAKGDHVGERVEFPAEVAGGVGHAGDAAVERVEGNGEEDGDGRPVEVHMARRW